MKTYNAKQWLEKTLPEGGEWRRANNHDYFYWFPSPVEDWGVVFYRNGRVYGTYYTSPSGRDTISRSTAIDLMCEAIKAGAVSGDATEASNDCDGDVGYIGAHNNPPHPDPYAHLPHGGWWVDSDDNTFWWSNGTLSEWYSLSGESLGRSYISTVDGSRLTRDQIIAIIEAHKASKEPTPALAFKVGDKVRHKKLYGDGVVAEIADNGSVKAAFDGDMKWCDPRNLELIPDKASAPAPSFGGPHDAEAVKWAAKHYPDHEVVGYRHPSGNELFIANSDALDTKINPWHTIIACGLTYGPRYILAPLAQPEPEPGKEERRGPVLMKNGYTIMPTIDPQLFELVKAVLPARAAMEEYDGMKWAEGIASDTMQIAKAMLSELRKEGE